MSQFSERRRQTYPAPFWTWGVTCVTSDGSDYRPLSWTLW